jgi:hypothetical protein
MPVKFGGEAQAAFSKVVERFLHDLGLLFERSVASVQDLNRFRSDIAASLAARPIVRPV